MANGKALAANGTEGAATANLANATGSSLSQDNPAPTSFAATDVGGLSEGQKIGLGIGIPLAVLLLVSSGISAYFTRTWSRQRPDLARWLHSAWGRPDENLVAEWPTVQKDNGSTPWQQRMSKIVEAPGACAVRGSLVELPAEENPAWEKRIALGTWFKD